MRDQVVDALIKGPLQRHPLQGYSDAIGILVAAGSDERVIAALTNLAGPDKWPRVRVDAAEALVRLGDDRGVELLTAAMRSMSMEEHLFYAASRLRALDRSDTALEVLLAIASDTAADAWTRAQAAVVATAYDAGDAAVERLKNLADASKEPAFLRYLAQAVRSTGRADEARNVLVRLAADEGAAAVDRWEAICSLRDSGFERQASDLAMELAQDLLTKGQRDRSLLIAAAIEAGRLGLRLDVSRLLLRLADETPGATSDDGPVDAAVEAGRLGALAEATELLCQWGADHSRDGTARLAAAKGLIRLKHLDIALSLLSGLADDEDVTPTVRASAALQRELTRPKSEAPYPLGMLAARFVALARDWAADPDERMEALRGLKALDRRSDARHAAAALVQDPELGEIARIESLGEFDGIGLCDGEVRLLLTTAQTPLNGWKLRLAAAKILAQAGMTEHAAPVLRALVVQEGSGGQEAAIDLMRELGLAEDLAEVCREDVEFHIAKAAVTALVALKNLDRVRQLTTDRAATPKARLCAAEALLSDGDDNGRQALRDLALRETDPNHLIYAAYALHRLGASADSAFVLRAKATDENAAADLRLRAISSLLGSSASASASNQADLVRIAHHIAARQDATSAARRELLTALGDRPGALDTLLALMTSRAIDPETRLHAAGLVAEIGDPPQCPCETLIDLAKRGEAAAHIRSSARKLAVRLGCPDAADALTSAMKNSALGHNERMEAAVLAVELGVPQAGSTLTTLIIRIPTNWSGGRYRIVGEAIGALARHSNWRSLIKIASAPEAPYLSRLIALNRLAEKDVKYLTATTRDDRADSHLRASAALRAWNYGVRSPVLKTLLHIAHDQMTSPGDRVEAAKAIGYRDEAQAAHSLRSLLEEDGLSDAEAVQAAAAFAEMAASDAVLDVAQAPGVSIEARTWLAAWKLPELGLVEEARSLLIELGSAPNIDCKQKKKIASEHLPRLGRTNAGVKILLDLTRSSQVGPEQLDAVAAALAKIAPTDVLARLADADAPNDSTQCAAAEGLWRRGRRDAAGPVLLDLAGRATTATRTRVKACHVLIKAGSREATEIGEQLLLDPILDEALRFELLNDLLTVAP